MIMGIPASLAWQMAADKDDSFIGKRSKLAYPDKRIEVNMKDIEHV
jgi:hypothetical protein